MTTLRDFRIAIADDHPVIRHAVVDALNGLPRFKVEAAVSSGMQLLNLLASDEWDLIVTDISMDTSQSSTDGLSLIARLRSQYAHVPIVVFTMLNNDDSLIRLSRSGIAGIVDKTDGIEEFRAAVMEVMSNRRPYFSKNIRARLQERLDASTAPGSPQMLTKKEIAVIRQIAAGASLTEIARQMNRSISTVATQKSTAMKKLHVQTNAQLIRYAQENGLI